MWSGPIRIASVPSGHSYVRHLGDPDGVPDGIERLTDPPVPGAPVGQWWPSPMLDGEWVRAHADAFDLLHIHFGFDDRSPAQLRSLTATLRAVGKPLVVTVHDLRNPHQTDPTVHAGALDVLVAAADSVITLTPGAAAEINRRWRRTPIVIPHPHVVDLDRMRRSRASHEGFVVGLHAKSERANNNSVAVALAAARAVEQLPGASLRIDVHDDRRGRAVAAELGGLDVRVHARFSDDELWDYLSGLDVSVLPYRFGTHSGWLEACRDLGTTALVPSCGYYEEQGPCISYRHDETGLDGDSLVAGVRTVYEQRPDCSSSPAARYRERREIAAAHRRLYADAMGIAP